MRIAFEFKPQDCWVGVYWQRNGRIPFDWHHSRPPSTDIWIGLIPMFPLHIHLGTTAYLERSESAWEQGMPYLPAPAGEGK